MWGCATNETLKDLQIQMGLKRDLTIGCYNDAQMLMSVCLCNTDMCNDPACKPEEVYLRNSK